MKNIKKLLKLKKDTTMKKITILCADEGNNLKLAESIKNEIKKINKATPTLINLINWNVPLYTYQKEVEIGIPDIVKDFSKTCDSSNGFIIVSPEYNGSIPPVLSSALAWASRATQDWRQSFKQKPVGLASHNWTGGQKLFISLQILLSTLGLNVLSRTISVTPQKEMSEQAISSLCKELIGN